MSSLTLRASQALWGLIYQMFHLLPYPAISDPSDNTWAFMMPVYSLRHNEDLLIQKRTKSSCKYQTSIVIIGIKESQTRNITFLKCDVIYLLPFGESEPLCHQVSAEGFWRPRYQPHPNPPHCPLFNQLKKAANIENECINSLSDLI